MNKTYLPETIGPLHFIGIGGIGMSGIAEILINLGYSVQGSDVNASKITDRLQKLGARIFIGHDVKNLAGVKVVIVSSAIEPGNPELDAAYAQGFSVVRRAEMLAELMRLKSNIAVAGTHGKTTTTSLIAELLVHGGLDPTVINGGVLHSLGSNARHGQSQWMVVEADESDGTFERLPATIAVVTNIDPEHMQHWKDLDALRQGFFRFVSNIPFYGLVICCTDHPEVQSLVGKIQDRQVRTYGFNAQADIRAVNLEFIDGAMHFDVLLHKNKTRIDGCVLPMPGAHNVSNALAAISAGLHIGLTGAQIREGLAKFRGVNRRFTQLGEFSGATLIDDYAHHPVEIAAVLSAARQMTKGRVIAIHQPHRFTRLEDLFEDFCTCFNEADLVAITDVFAAGEPPIDGIDNETLVAGLTRHGHKGACAIDAGPASLEAFIQRTARPNDVVLCLGAGSISLWANQLIKHS